MKHAHKKIPIGISSCLIGEAVRYNGGHKKDAYINNQLVHFFDFRTVCPEVGIGMGIPRDPIRLVKTAKETRVLGVKDASVDVTDKLHQYGIKTASKLHDVCGYIFKSRSPSCGMARVKTYNDKGLPAKSDGVGAYAEEIMKALPNLPVEEEGRLHDPGLRENFINRVFTYYRWKQFLADGLSAAGLVEFHTKHKLTVMAHNQAAYKRLGQMISNTGRKNLQKLAVEYEAELMQALQRQATRKQHANVLQHLQGYFSKFLSADDREEMTRLIDEYRQGLIPLIAPLTLIQHHLRHFPNDWALNQSYLEPYPKELHY